MDFFKKILTDVNGDTSSKRMISFLAFGVMVGSWFANTFFGLVVDPVIFDGFMYVLMVGIGAVASEKFARK